LTDFELQFASSKEIKELPEDAPNDVLFDSQGGVRSILLNRPKKLNSLDASMIRKIVPRLREWSRSDMANVIVIKGEGRAFCAGGDVASLASQNKSGAEGQQASKDYFALEYKLDHLIATYQKPYVAFIDGITMGGGVGLSLHAPFRIATENTVFAMPETNIGLFPDVGASFFLPRLAGSLGMYLALTSEQLKGVQAFYAGVATHYLHSSSLPDLEARLAELQFRDHENLQSRLNVINSTIEEFSTGLPHDQPISAPVGGNIRSAIDFCFQSSHNIDDVFNSFHGLENPPRDPDRPNDPPSLPPQEILDWIEKTRNTIRSRSPTSVKVTYRQLTEGARWSIAETFRKEHGIASKFMEHADFVEGVSALLIDKPKRKPTWTPASFVDVSDKDVDAFFTNKTEFELLDQEAGSTGQDYTSYPHARFALPTDQAVEACWKSGMRHKQILQKLTRDYNGKQGVKEKVEDILSRRANTSQWN
jgi:3-hydroxyisobutyryl-CoA hydrolase